MIDKHLLFHIRNISRRLDFSTIPAISRLEVSNDL